MAKVAKSEFEYFHNEPYVFQIDRSSYREFTPISALQDSNAIEFLIPPTERIYLDLSRSYLYVRAKIVRPDGTNIVAGTQIGPINNTLHSLFSNVEVELCGTRITDPNGLYPYRAYIENTLSYNKDTQEHQLQSVLWYKDTPGAMESLISNGDHVENVGLSSRANFFANGAEVEMLGRPHSEIFHQGRALPQNCKVKIKFNRSKDSFLLMSGAAVTDANPQVEYRMKIVDARMFIMSFEMEASTILTHEQMLQKQNMRFPLRYVTLKTLAIPNNQSTITHDNIYTGTLPRRIVLGLVSDASLAGSYQLNPLNFQHYNVNYIVLVVDGKETVPAKAFQPNFHTGQYLREYMSLYQGTDSLFSNRSINVTRDEYPQGYTFWVFDLSNDIGAQNCFSLPRSGSVRLELKFAENTTETINVVCYAEFDHVLEIDQYRNVIVA